MKNIFLFIWQKKWVLVIFVILIIIIFFLLMTKKITRPTETPLPTGGATWKEIVPGNTNRTDVDKILGNPLSENKSGNKTINTYASPSQTRPNEVVFNENGVTQLIKRIITDKDNLTVKDLIDKYGKEEILLYNADSVNGLNLCVYASKGIAFVGNLEGNTLFEVWYFPPTNQSGFMTNYGAGYSTTMPNIPF